NTVNLKSEFFIYERNEARSTVSKLVIKEFNCYLSFIGVNGKILGYVTYPPKDSDYIVLVSQVSIVQDKHKTKYAPESSGHPTSRGYSVRTIAVLERRFEVGRGIFTSM